MASVRYNLRKNKSKDPHIMLVYRLESDTKKLVFGTDLHVPEQYWNPKKMRVKETVDFIEHRDYNAILDRWESSVMIVRNRFKLAGKRPTLNEFRTEVKKEFLGGTQISTAPDIFSYFDEFIENKRLANRKSSTIIQYNNARNLLSEFVTKKEHGRRIEFNDMTKNFILRFIAYCEADKDHEANTINKTMKRIRAVMNEATKRGINTLLDFRDEDCNRAYVKQPKVCIFQHEFDQIMALDLEPFGRLDKVRDIFITGYYTALRYIDLKSLSEKHITTEHERDVIKIKAEKTEGFVTIPLKPIVKEVMSKHGGKLPIISEQKFRDYIKELCQKAGLTTKASRVKKGNQEITEKWKLKGSHTMRRSFATNAILNGINPEFVRRITGHSTLKQLYEYVCIDSKEYLDFATENEFFK